MELKIRIFARSYPLGSLLKDGGRAKDYNSYENYFLEKHFVSHFAGMDGT